MASKRKSLCIDEKAFLIRAIEAGETKSDVGKRFGFSRSTVSTIWKNREKILQAEESGKFSKKLKRPKYENLDQAMLSWFHRQRQNNMPVSGPIIKAKAEEFAKELRLMTFKASEGWLGKFKQRHHINYGKANGEARSVEVDITHEWINRVWPQLKEKYTPRDIFNADEAGIFFKLTPDQTLEFKGEECVGGRLSKERITVLVATNMNGTEKRKLVVIGKSKYPQCFKNIRQLPVIYKGNKSAWMTSKLFKEELRRWDEELKGRKILLLVDSCPAHPFISNLQNIELAFFPPNMTSVLQPMEQHVIKSLKDHYRRKILMELVESEGTTSINMLHAVTFLSKAWEEVTATTIQHSFRDAGLCASSGSVEVETGAEFESEDDLPLTEWVEHFDIPQNFTQNLQTYVEVDDNLATTALLTDEEILNSVKRTEQQGDEEDDDSDDPEPLPSVKQALDAAKLLEKYFLYNKVHPTVSQDMNKIYKKIQLKYWNSKKRQT